MGWENSAQHVKIRKRLNTRTSISYLKRNLPWTSLYIRWPTSVPKSVRPHALYLRAVCVSSFLFDAFLYRLALSRIFFSVALRPFSFSPSSYMPSSTVVSLRPPCFCWCFREPRSSHELRAHIRTECTHIMCCVCVSSCGVYERFYRAHTMAIRAIGSVLWFGIQLIC